MKNHLFFNFLILLTLLSIISFGHGEDKAGPHGGYVRMPGAFHTEVIKEKKGFRIYLLDINWKNPTVKDSSLQAALHLNDKKTDLKCAQETESFFCACTSLQKGQLLITATREGQVGNQATYDLPLKFTLDTTKEPQKDHSGHQGHH